MGDPVTTSLALSGGKSIFEGLAGRAAAKGEQARANANAYIGETRAIQTDTVSRENLESDLGSARAIFGANQQGANVSVLELLGEIRSRSARDRRINVGNERSRAADFRLQSRNARSRGNVATIGGFVRAAPDLYSLYDYNRTL